MEIELKLACDPDALTSFEAKVLPELTNAETHIKQSKHHLFNEYYDTPDEYFGSREMGLRLRARNKVYEQTIKTKGQVVGGLHQRPEYNVSLQQPNIDLSLFDKEIWGEDLDTKLLTSQLEILFATDFERTTFIMEHSQYTVEIVFDFGLVKKEQDSVPICEIELELVKGEPLVLFEIAQVIIKHISSRLSNQTKAARGYQLIHGKQAETKELPKYLALNIEDATEDAFCKALSVALEHWQYHQMVYAQTANLKALTQIRESVELLLQGVALYLPILQCQELLSLHKLLLRLTQKWAWQEQLQSIHQLRSRKGPFSRKVPKNQNVMNYLMGRREGLLNAHKPDEINKSLLSTQVQLSVSRLLIEKPWRSQNSGADIPVRKHANGWLSQAWQTMQQSLPRTSGMDDKQYLALEVLLKQSLINGFLLADLFVESRGNFRAPWVDLASGIEELKALKLIHDAMEDLAAEDKREFSSWIEDKTHSVIKVMEQTREVAMDADTYW